MEALRAPVSWWGLGALGAGAVGLVLSVATPWWGAAAGGLLVAALAGAGLLAAGRLRVGVRDGEVVAGVAHVPLHHCGSVTPLDPDATRRARGPDADANAYLVLRPWVGTAVRVDIADPTDPTPYWLVSTRHPDRFAAAVGSARADGAR